jgi:hypothetical protein
MEDQPIALDFASLRQQAISQLEQMSGRAWTDFNLHDPGITIMEALCYALSDLAYRASYSIPDLLSDGGNHAYESLHLAPEILSCNPVTLCDLRRLVLDVEGVKNVWIEPVRPAVDFYFHPGKRQLQLNPDPPSTQPVAMRGLYRVLIETSDISGIDGSVVRRNAALQLHRNRGLCEDFEAVHVLDPQMIQVQMAVEIGPVEDPTDLLVRILQAIDGQLSPSIPVAGLRALLDSGKAIDEIYEGPLLQHGFISPESLSLGDRRTSVNISDIVHAVMDVQDVRAVRSVTLTSGGQTEAWSLPVDPQKAPRLDVAGSTFLLEREGIVAALDFPAAIAAYNKKQLENGALNRSGNGEDLLAPPAGRDRHIENYYSLQHHLPPAYGIGEMGLPESATEERKARAKQLKGYLMMFDQLLVNEFAQLSHVRDLFSFTDSGTRTYFSQIVDDDSLHLEDIRATDLGTHQANVDTITEDSAAALTRKNRFLNHLLARFSEQFTNYSFVLPQALPTALEPAPVRLVRDKQAFLRRYPRMSSARGTAIDYLVPLGPDNLSGLEERVSLRLGLGPDEQFILVEHILLRPMEGDEQQMLPLLSAAGSKDPYSLQVSFVFPAVTDRMSRPDAPYRRLIERTVREETPAHITPYVHWLSSDAWQKFQPSFQAWIAARRMHWAEKFDVKV